MKVRSSSEPADDSFRSIAKIESQTELEQAMREYGFERHLRRLQRLREDGHTLAVRSSRDLFLEAASVFARAIEEDLIERHGRGRRPDVSKLLKNRFGTPWDPWMLGCVVLREIFDVILEEPLESELARRVGRAIQHELAVSCFEPDIQETLFRRVRIMSVPASQRVSLIEEAEDHSGTFAPSLRWSDEQIAKVGHHFFVLADLSTGLFADPDRSKELVQVSRTKDGSKKKKFRETVRLRIKPEVLRELEKQDQLDALRKRDWLPMIERPRPWIAPRSGGYQTIDYPLLGESAGREQRFVERMVGSENVDLGQVFRCMNKLQDTAWTINHDVLRVAEHFLREGGLHGDRRIPPWPTEEQRKRGEARAIRNRRRAGEAAVVLARDFAGREVFWLPSRADSRGRIYTIPSVLSPIGGDLQRALLQFREPKSLASVDGYRWLLRHGANVLGEDGSDKLAADAQVSLMESRAMRERVGAIAADPMRSVNLWRAAGHPWQFLAFCFEYTRYLEPYRAGQRPAEAGPDLEFETVLPVALDGTCSGLQHLSLAMLDPFGAEHTNLVGGRRCDLYGLVAERLEAMLQERVSSGDKMARRWLNSRLIARSFVKRPVMATPYGITNDGVKNAIIEKLEDAQVAGQAPGFKPNEYEFAASQLVKPLREVVEALIVKAPEAMVYLKNCARAVVEGGRDPYWITPAGFPACREYRNSYIKRVRTMLSGSYHLPRHKQTSVVIDTKRISRKRHAKGAAPNWTHSQDAAHLVLAVNAFADQGGGPIATVHDSFMVTAADAPKMQRVLLEALVAMYRGHPLEEFRRHLMDTFHVRPPTPPRRGDLDVEEVLRSGDYAFA
jgi:DNA-directed RNA polymerase